ncbi:MAG: DUF2339 domain-containing protein [Rhodobacteraceae bacterium]|nr:DUF2339 domain-containing protein [Paracoccaceae bacterium]
MILLAGLLILLGVLGFLAHRRMQQDIQELRHQLIRQADRLKLLESRKSPDNETADVGADSTAAADGISQAKLGETGGPWDPARIAAAPVEIPRRSVSGSALLAKADDKAAARRSYVFNRQALARFGRWAQANWFYLVAAVSLGLAGVFFVQYGIENGYLTPPMRVLAALALGAVLILGGEYLRRKGGDRADDLFAYLPSTFAAGGLISLFAGLLSARLMYGLIGAETAFAALALVAALAVLIGWFYGPLLAAIGILGAFAAPFLVAGDPGAAALLYYFFALVAVAALLVDSFKRWAWVSAFALVLGFAAASLMFAGSGEAVHFVAFALIVTVAATIIPERSIVPLLAGPSVGDNLIAWWRKRKDATQEIPPSSFPVRLVFGVFLAATCVAVWVLDTSSGGFWLSMAGLSGLFLLAVIWMRLAPGLWDLAAMPLVAMPLVLFAESQRYSAVPTVRRQWLNSANPLGEDPTSPIALLIVATAVIFSILMALRSWRAADYANVWAFAGAVFAPLVVVELHMFWAPSLVFGAALWATYVMAVAAVMVALALGFARIDGEARQRVALFALAALTMIALAMVLMLSSSALTLALALMVLLAVWLDKRFGLPALAVFVWVGAGVTTWRMMFVPGMIWAQLMPFWELFGTFVLVLAMLWAAQFLLDRGKRPRTFTVIEAAFWTLLAAFGMAMILRLFDTFWPDRDSSHAALSLMALVWLISAANQLWRLKGGVTWRWVRITLAVIYLLPGLALLVGSGLFANPLWSRSEPVFGPPVLDSLLVAYLLPALFFLLVAVWFRHFNLKLRYAIGAVGVLYAGIYVGLEIRRLWRGDILNLPGVTVPELYSYTLAMLVASTGLLFYAFWRHSPWLRKLALAGIGLTVAKVFLIDISGLSGLTRVVSFLGLGLAVAGLAWLDRWFGAKEGGDGAAGAPVPENPAD